MFVGGEFGNAGGYFGVTGHGVFVDQPSRDNDKITYAVWGSRTNCRYYHNEHWGSVPAIAFSCGGWWRSAEQAGLFTCETGAATAGTASEVGSLTDVYHQDNEKLLDRIFGGWAGWNSTTTMMGLFFMDDHNGTANGHLGSQTG